MFLIIRNSIRKIWRTHCNRIYTCRRSRRKGPYIIRDQCSADFHCHGRICPFTFTTRDLIRQVLHKSHISSNINFHILMIQSCIIICRTGIIIVNPISYMPCFFREGCIEITPRTNVLFPGAWNNLIPVKSNSVHRRSTNRQRYIVRLAQIFIFRMPYIIDERVDLYLGHWYQILLPATVIGQLHSVNTLMRSIHRYSGEIILRCLGDNLTIQVPLHFIPFRQLIA